VSEADLLRVLGPLVATARQRPAGAAIDPRDAIDPVI
jgi:hypothetical protein